MNVVFASGSHKHTQKKRKAIFLFEICVAQHLNRTIQHSTVGGYGTQPHIKWTMHRANVSIEHIQSAPNKNNFSHECNEKCNFASYSLFVVVLSASNAAAVAVLAIFSLFLFISTVVVGWGFWLE